jgi:nucleotide-binding universal stress UspA family protein
LRVAYRTIVVHLSDEVRAEGLLDVAIALARRSSAHLIGVAVLPPPMIAALGLPDEPAPVLMEDYRRAYIKECQRMQVLFQQRTESEGIAAHWQLDDAWDTTVAVKVLGTACSADLIVAGQADRDAPGAEQLDIADYLIIESGRPVVVVPNGSRPAAIGRRILLAWNGRREAARVIFDALDLLQSADEVRIVAIKDDRNVTAEASINRICATLKRHGVKCTLAEYEPQSNDVGKALLRCVAQNSSDLLVMGCYGHSRLREFIFGGATRHVLKHMTVPVLMAH